MIIRHPLTVLTLAALLMASGAALAGGMPSDEGPEVILDTLGFTTGDSLDENTITAIIKSQMPDYVFPAAFVDAVAVAVAPKISPIIPANLSPALFRPQEERQR